MTAHREPVVSHLKATIEGEILTVVIDRAEKRNALSRAVLAEIGAVFAAHATDVSLRGAILTGAGERCFAAGGDLHELAALRTREQAAGMAADAKAALDAVREFPVPVVAALNGDALGGGAELAVACDFRVAVTGARIGFLQSRLAITPAWGGSIDLMDLVGRRRALRLMATAEMLTAQDACEGGLIDMVAAPEETAVAAARRFLSPMSGRPAALLRSFKSFALAHRRHEPRPAMLDLETREFAEAWVSEDHWAAAASALK